MSRTIKIISVILVSSILLILIVPLIILIKPAGEITDPRQLAYPDSQWTEVNDIDVHYQEAGAGEPALVLLHPFASSTSSWQKVMDPLAAAGHKVLAFDRPAYGLTERPINWEGANPYTARFATDLVPGLMDALNLNQAVLIGNSAGGTVAVATALKYPDRVKALVLVDAAIYNGAPASPLIRWLYKTPQMNRLGPLLARQIVNRGQNLINMAYHDPTKITQAEIESYTRPLQIKNWDRALWEATIASEDLGLSQQLTRLNLPVLVITGNDDRIVPTQDSIRLAGEIPNAELVVIPNCGHLPQEECPAEFLQAVNNFLARLPD
jgi:pimeloyl-ACP methyl ester carboxylesterase